MSDSPPNVVPKVVQDIDLINGQLNETVAEEACDWTKDLTNIENLVQTPGQFVQRKGATSLATTDDASTTLAPCFRLGALNGGLGLVGNSYQLYHLNEKTGLMANKGRMPEFSVTKRSCGGTSDVTAVTGVSGTAILTNYYAIAYQGEFSTTISQLTIDLVDPKSNNVVRTWTITSSGLHTYTMVGVAGRYLHIYRSLAGGSTAPGVAVIDTNSLSATGAISPSFTAFTSSVAGDYVAGVVPMPDGTGSVACITSSASNNRIEKFNNSATSLSNAAVAGFTTLSGLDTDGTNFYVAGRVLQVSAIANLTLNTFLQASFSASPWVGQASAGGSGTNNYTGATPPAVGTAVNGLTPASFSGTQSLNGTTATGAGTTQSWVALLNVSNYTAGIAVQYNGVCRTLFTGTANQLQFSVGGTLNTIAWPSNTWVCLGVNRVGTSCNIYLNHRDPITFTCGATGSASTGVLGNSAGGGSFQLLEFIGGDVSMSRGQFEDIRDILATRYALPL